MNTLSAAEYRAQLAQKSAATPPRPPNPAPVPPEPRQEPDLPPPHYTHENGAATWLLGNGQAVSRAREFSPGRHRLVVTGPVDVELLKHILTYQKP